MNELTNEGDDDDDTATWTGGGCVEVFILKGESRWQVCWGGVWPSLMERN